MGYVPPQQQLAVGAMPPRSPGWPPSNLTAGQLADATTSAGQVQARLPSATQLDYANKLITTALLVLALPALVSLLLTKPGALFAGLGGKHLA